MTLTSRTARLAALILLLLVFTFGCWNRVELSRLGLLAAVGLDKGQPPDAVRLTLQLIRAGEVKPPAMGGGSSPAVWILSVGGSTVFDAARRAALQSSREIRWSQAYTVVIGEEMARDGIAPFLDFINRYRELRDLIWVLVTKGEAEPVLKAEHELEKIPAKAMDSMVKASYATSFVPAVRLHDFCLALSAEGQEPFAPGIEVIPLEETPSAEDTEGGDRSGVGSGGQGKQRFTFRLRDTAVFLGDRMVGWMDDRETRGLLWVRGEVKNGIIVVRSPGSEAGDVSLEIIRAHGKVTPQLKEGRLVVRVEITEEGNLEEQLSSGDLTKPEMFSQLEAAQSQAIAAEIQASVDKAKELGADVFGFGAAVHRRYPQLWKELGTRWSDEFRALPVEVSVKAKLSRFGLTTTATWPR